MRGGRGRLLLEEDKKDDALGGAGELLGRWIILRFQRWFYFFTGIRALLYYYFEALDLESGRFFFYFGGCTVVEGCKISCAIRFTDPSRLARRLHTAVRRIKVLFLLYYFPAAENDRPNDCLIGLICYLSYTAADCPAREKCQHEELPRWKEKFQAVPSLGLDSEL